MKKLGILMFTACFVFLLTACGSEDNNDNTNSSEEMKPIEVNILTVPETLNPEEISTIQAKVTQGSEQVDDAEEVEFELWKKGSDDHEKIEAEKQGNGLYSIQHTFEEKGFYYVIAHVTARGMHNMPQKKLNVGDVSEKEQGEENQEHAHEEGSSESHSHEHGSAEGEIAVHLMRDEGKLMVHLQKGEAPFTEAAVRFEVWQGDAKHQFIDAQEGKKGEYTAEFKPESSGTYSVKVHYEKGELHGHKQEEIEM